MRIEGCETSGYKTLPFSNHSEIQLLTLPYMKLKIIERSPLARIARLVLNSPNVAMVLGEHIHLSGVTRADFLRDKAWVAHELCHIEQFRQHGFFRFLGLYLLESMRKGYYHNCYEVEAREAGVKGMKN